MKTLIVVLLVVALIPEGVMAARWNRAELSVWDFLPQTYRPSLQRVVDDFNANRPAYAPVLTYIAMPERMCEDLNPKKVRDGIAVCVSNRVPDPTPAQQPRVINRHGIFVSGTIALRNYAPLKTDNIFCHEMMHAIADAPDLDGPMRDSPHLDDSCVLGVLDHLGAWDIAYLEQIYAIPPVPHRDKRHKTRHHANHRP